MKDREALKIEAAPLDPLTAADGFGGFLSTIFVVAAAGAVVFGLLASGSGEPLLLTIIAVLAMLGLFLLFGIAAGHVRIGARMPAGDVLKAAADAIDEPQMVTHPMATCSIRTRRSRPCSAALMPVRAHPSNRRQRRPGSRPSPVPPDARGRTW